MYRQLQLTTLVLLLTSPVIRPATPTIDREPRPCEIWGQIAGSARLLQEGLSIELVGPGGAAKQKVLALANGDFDFRSVPPGDYRFRVIDRAGVVILEQTKSLGGKNDFVFLPVRDPRLELTARDTVSLQALQHKAPRRAWNAFRTAQKARSAGDTNKSIQYLQEALSVDEDFAEAHSDLAAIFAETGRTEEALDHAQTAFRLDPQLAEAGCNFALLLVSLKRYPEAEIAARRMLSAPYYPSVLHGVLAISLIEQRKDMNQALAHLQQAVSDSAIIRLLAANALCDVGRGDLAVLQVEEYLRSSAHDCERPALESWLASVRSQLTSDR